MVSDVFISAHAKCVKRPQTNERADNVQRAIGKMQPSCIVPERQQIPFKNFLLADGVNLAKVV